MRDTDFVRVCRLRSWEKLCDKSCAIRMDSSFARGSLSQWTSKITIPAVKIAGAVSLLPEDSMMLPAALCPDPCMSSNETKLELDPMAEIKPMGLLLPDLEDEFGEFLLDAVTWL